MNKKLARLGLMVATMTTLCSCNNNKTATKFHTAYICIALIEKGKKDECHEEIALPYFDRDKMYKGMELDRKYTLEELGL